MRVERALPVRGSVVSTGVASPTMVVMSNIAPRPVNPIQQRKDAVRKYSRNAVISVGGGVVVGATLGLFFMEWWLFIVILGIGIAGGFINWRKVQQILNYRDPQ